MQVHNKVSSKDQILQSTREQILDVLVPQMIEQLVDVPKFISQDRIQRQTAAQIIDFPKGLYQETVQQRWVTSVPQERNSERKCEQIGGDRCAQVKMVPQVHISTIGSLVSRVQQFAVNFVVTTELYALLYQQAVFENIIDSREREAEYNKKVVEKEWPDLMLFLTVIQEQ